MRVPTHHGKTWRAGRKIKVASAGTSASQAKRIGDVPAQKQDQLSGASCSLPDKLCIGQLSCTESAEFAAEAGALDAAERRARV